MVRGQDQDGRVPNSRLTALLAYVTAEGRVCPEPDPWHRFFELLDRRARDDKDPPPKPIILAGWWSTPDLIKAIQLRAQIEWATRHGALLAADKYLRRVPQSEWLLAEGSMPAAWLYEELRKPAMRVKTRPQLSFTFR